MKILYFSPVKDGNNKYLEKIKENFKDSEHEIDYMIIDYTVDKGQKWQLAKQFLNPDELKQYDYVFVWDEDLDLIDFDIDWYVESMCCLGLSVSQPSLSHDSYHSHDITLTQLSSCRITDFVEIMCPVFSYYAWERMYEYLDDDNLMGWGYDFIFKSLGKIGIIDNFVVKHCDPIKSGSNRSVEDMHKLMQKHGITRPKFEVLEWIE